MNILFCQPTLDYTGSETSLLGIVRMLREGDGHRLFLLAGSDGPMAGEFEQTLDELCVVNAPKLRRSITVVPRYLGSFSTVFKKIRELKKRHGISVVYVNTVMFPQAVIGAFLNRLKCVVHIHEVESKYPWVYYQLYVALATLLANRVVCVCRYILDQRRIFFRERLLGKARVVYNASFFDHEPIRRSIGGTVRILNVGTLSRLKGTGDLLLFARTLEETIGDRRFELKIVGRVHDAELYKEVTKGLRETGLDNKVTFCGEQDDVEPFYMEAHVLLHPAHSETFPMVLVEAASLSLPAVTTDVGGCPEAVVHGKTGFIVPVGDTRAMAEHISRLADDASLYEAVCEAAYSRYRSRFTPDKMIAQIREILASLV